MSLAETLGYTSQFDSTGISSTVCSQPLELLLLAHCNLDNKIGIFKKWDGLTSFECQSPHFYEVSENLSTETFHLVFSNNADENHMCFHQDQ